MKILQEKFPLNTVDSALIGYTGGLLYNIAKGASVVNPLITGLALAGIALANKYFNNTVDRYIMGPNIYLGPIPIGLKNIVKFGLATNLTLSIMHIAGLIITVPPVISAFGTGCVAVYCVGLIGTTIKNSLAENNENLVKQT